MKITRRQLRGILREELESARLLSEALCMVGIMTTDVPFIMPAVIRITKKEERPPGSRKMVNVATDQDINNETDKILKVLGGRHIFSSDDRKRKKAISKVENKLSCIKDNYQDVVNLAEPFMPKPNKKTGRSRRGRVKEQDVALLRKIFRRMKGRGIASRKLSELAGTVSNIIAALGIPGGDDIRSAVA